MRDVWQPAFIFCVCASVPLAAHASFQDFVRHLQTEATERGLDATLIPQSFNNNIQPVQRAVQKSQNQPEVKYSFRRYQNALVSAARIRNGQQALAQNKDQFQNVAAKYGIPQEIIAALWGIESHYGTHKGTFPILPSLATLAYDSHRQDFFRREFFHALEIVDAGHISLSQFTGSWAGAMGQNQFIPSSYKHYAVDGDNDNKVDIWQNTADVLASTANYLKENGWHTSEPVAQRVILTKYLPGDLKLSRRGLSATQPLKHWLALGTEPTQPLNLPLDAPTRLFLPEGPQEKAYLVFNNFNTIMRWNNSSHFAFAVYNLAEALAS